MTEILILINPNSGTHQLSELVSAADALSRSTSLCRIDTEVVQSVEHSQELTAAAAAKGYYAVVVIGGDGTANTVGSVLSGTDTALGIVPAGSGNGVARHIGMSMDIKKALRQILLSKVYDIDTLRVNGSFCLGVAGTGFEAAVAQSFSMKKKRGLISYSTVAITEFFKYTPSRIHLNIDGQTINRTPFTVAFANSSQWGNDFKIAPDASMTSGSMKLVIISDIDQISVMPCVYGLISGNINTIPNCETINASRVRIEKPGISYHIDGEPMPPQDSLEVEIRPSSLKILSPKKRAF